MLFTEPTQFAVLALCLIAGWIFGLASHPGGKKAKLRVRELEAELAAQRREAEGRVKEAEARATAAESERDRLAKAAPVTAQTAAAPAAATAATGGGVRGFFGWGRDNLSRIRGIDQALETRMNAEGIKTYQQIETMPADDEIELERRLGLAEGTIAGEDWRAQAAMLREGHDDEHGRRFA